VPARRAIKPGLPLPASELGTDAQIEVAAFAPRHEGIERQHQDQNRTR
jgi:hypothetical protein